MDGPSHSSVRRYVSGPVMAIVVATPSVPVHPARRHDALLPPCATCIATLSCAPCNVSSVLLFAHPQHGPACSDGPHITAPRPA